MRMEEWGWKNGDGRMGMEEWGWKNGERILGKTQGCHQLLRGWQDTLRSGEVWGIG